jgi:hypothetical protein
MRKAAFPLSAERRALPFVALQLQLFGCQPHALLPRYAQPNAQLPLSS